MPITIVNEFINNTLADKIYDILRMRVIRQELQPGARLIDQEIADQLRVSRTPVREAITRLAAEGLVNVTSRRGAHVLSLSDRDIKELYELREALEVLAIELAGSLLKDEDVSALSAIMTEYSKAFESDDHLRCFDLDREFHDRLVSMSGNGRLISLYKTFGGNIQVSRWRHCNDSERTKKSIREHLSIVDALAQRDVPQAVGRVREHIRTVKSDLLKGGKDGKG
jgi:DNA-binding GntR family transcriptional regulator